MLCTRSFSALNVDDSGAAEWLDDLTSTGCRGPGTPCSAGWQGLCLSLRIGVSDHGSSEYSTTFLYTSVHGFAATPARDANHQSTPVADPSGRQNQFRW